MQKHVFSLCSGYPHVECARLVNRSKAWLAGCPVSAYNGLKVLIVVYFCDLHRIASLHIEHYNGTIQGAHNHELAVRRHTKFGLVHPIRASVLFCFKARLKDGLPGAYVPHFDHMVLSSWNHVSFIGRESGARDLISMGSLKCMHKLGLSPRHTPEFQVFMVGGGHDGLWPRKINIVDPDWYRCCCMLCRGNVPQTDRFVITHWD